MRVFNEMEQWQGLPGTGSRSTTDGHPSHGFVRVRNVDKNTHRRHWSDTSQLLLGANFGRRRRSLPGHEFGMAAVAAIRRRAAYPALHLFVLHDPQPNEKRSESEPKPGQKRATKYSLPWTLWDFDLTGESQLENLRSWQQDLDAQ